MQNLMKTFCERREFNINHIKFNKMKYVLNVGMQIRKDYYYY